MLKKCALAVGLIAVGVAASTFAHQRGNDNHRNPQEGGCIPFDTIVVNLNESRLNRFLMLEFAVIVDPDDHDASVRALGQQRRRVKDWLNLELADKSVADIAGRENQEELRQQIIEGINERLAAAGHPKYVTDLLFDRLAVQ